MSSQQSVSVKKYIWPAALLCAALPAAPSQAQSPVPPPVPPSAAPAPAAAPCSLRGISQPSANTAILATDGKPIARFSGAESPLVAQLFPAAASGRALVETGLGKGSFRIKGQVDLGKLPVFTAQSVPIAAGHLWLGAHRRVTVINAAPGRLKVQKVLSYPFMQAFTAWGPCSAFSLSSAPPLPVSYPTDSSGYVLEQGTLDLFDGPGPSNLLVSTLFRAPEAPAVLFWSGERQGAWVHVLYQGDVIVDAWAKASELRALPRGETIDQLAPPNGSRPSARVALQGQPRTVRTTKEVPLRAAASDSAAVIGVIEIGTDTHVLDVMAGWVSVMPQTLHVLPPENGQFWAKASELGI